MAVKTTVNLAQFKQQLKANADELHAAGRPAAQAGTQIIYDRARLICPESKRSHMFHGTHQVYGPYLPGNLRESIYQVFSKSKSFKDVATYEVSWNHREAPYGFMVEFGTSHSPAKSFIGRAMIETRTAVRAAIKERFIAEISK